MARTRLSRAARRFVRSFDDLLRDPPSDSQREVFADTDAESPHRTGPDELVVGTQDAVLLEALARSRDSALSRAMVRLRSGRVQGLLVDLTRELTAPAGPDPRLSPFASQDIPLGPSAQAVGRAYADALFPAVADDTRLGDLLHPRLHQLWSGPLPEADEQVRLAGDFTSRLSDMAGLRGASYGRAPDEPRGPDPLLAALHDDPRRDKAVVVAERLIAASSVPAVSPGDRQAQTARLAGVIGVKYLDARSKVGGGQPADLAADTAAAEVWDEYFRVVSEHGVEIPQAAAEAEAATDVEATYGLETTAAVRTGAGVETVEAGAGVEAGGPAGVETGAAGGPVAGIEVDRWIGQAGSDGRAGGVAPGTVAGDPRAPGRSATSKPEQGR